MKVERQCRHYWDEYGFETRVVRFHSMYGPLGTHQGGREKAPAALCRKIALAPDGGEIDVWGDGEQTRSYCYINDCVDDSDNTRVRDILGWRRRVALEDGLAQTSRWIERELRTSEQLPVATVGAREVDPGEDRHSAIGTSIAPASRGTARCSSCRRWAAKR